jgi:hypothetical protein
LSRGPRTGGRRGASQGAQVDASPRVAGVASWDSHLDTKNGARRSVRQGCRPVLSAGRSWYFRTGSGLSQPHRRPPTPAPGRSRRGGTGVVAPGRRLRLAVARLPPASFEPYSRRRRPRISSVAVRPSWEG